MSYLAKVEMSYWLIECPSFQGGQHGQRGQDYHEREGAEAVSRDPAGFRPQDEASASGGGLGAFGSADSAPGEAGWGGGRAWSGPPQPGEAFQWRDGWESQGPCAA